MNNTANQEQYEEEIDLIELITVLWKKMAILVACFVIGFGLLGFISKMLITPLYQSSSTIYIFSKTTSITSLADIQMGSQLTVDFQHIASTREVMERAARELDLDYTYEEMSSRVVVTNPTNTHMLTITVTDPDPVLAANLSNKLSDILREQVAEIMNTDRPSTVEKAVVAERPSSPHVLKNALIGGLVGAFGAAAVIVVLYMLDDTIKTDEDVKKYLELEVLAAIPYDPTMPQEKSSKNKRKQSKKYKVKSKTKKAKS